ncbi:MAG: ompA family protein [Micavibrio sp.]|nr:ompA family protein [Micavibrio sp.]
MTKLRGLILAGLAVALAGCSGISKHSEIEALNQAQPSGSPFTQYLAAEYRDYANLKNKQMLDYPDAIHFARKGLAASSGDVVMPEPLSDWNLLPKHMEELGTARGRLVNAFDLGARDLAPQLGAIAQARFDCWIEQQEESWQKDVTSCKNQFMDAMNQLESMLKKPAAMPAATGDDMGPVSALDGANGTMKAEDAMYLVFFDFNKSNITAGADSVLDAVVAELHKRGKTSIQVVGHTDTSGSDSYNEKLAMRRANAVKAALAKRGVDVKEVGVEGRGEKELLVKTADGVREPANRRAQITFK